MAATTKKVEVESFVKKFRQSADAIYHYFPASPDVIAYNKRVAYRPEYQVALLDQLYEWRNYILTNSPWMGLGPFQLELSLDGINITYKKMLLLPSGRQFVLNLITNEVRVIG